ILVIRVVALQIPTVDDRVPNPLRPKIDATADHPAPAGGRRIESWSVDPVRHSVVLPRKIVEPFGYVPREYTRLERRYRHVGRLDDEARGGFSLGGIVSKNQVVV